MDRNVNKRVTMNVMDVTTLMVSVIEGVNLAGEQKTVNNVMYFITLDVLFN